MALRHRFRREQKITHCRSRRRDGAPALAAAARTRRCAKARILAEFAPRPPPAGAAWPLTVDARVASHERIDRAADARRRSRARRTRCARASSSRFRPRPSTAWAPTPRNPDGRARIFAAKGRPADHPVIVHLPDASQSSAGRARCPTRRDALAAAFWPGPLTLILPRAPRACRRRHRRPGQRRPARAVASGRARAARSHSRSAARHRRAVGQPLRPHLADHGARTSPTISATRWR